MNKYTFNNDCNLTDKEKNNILKEIENLEDNIYRFFIDGMQIGEAFPEEIIDCEKFVGKKYEDVLLEMLHNIATEINVAFMILFEVYHEKFDVKNIPQITALAMSDIIDYCSEHGVDTEYKKMFRYPMI